MATKGQKISKLVYSTLGDAVNDGAQVPVSIDINGTKSNRRVPIEEIKGYQGNQGTNGSNGSQGAQGAQGASVTGSQGAQGNQGASVTGSQGAQGNQGNQGGTTVGAYNIVVAQYGTISSYSNNTLYFLYA